MHRLKPLPNYLVQRFHGWKATGFVENRVWLKRLAEDGQRPRAMMIACCDSRVHVTSIFGADEGEFFIHRNIANLVPPCKPDGEHHGTSAAIEFAVTELKVAHLIVLGHSGCGGVKGCHEMCAGHAPHLNETSSFVGRWMDILRPGYDRVKDVSDERARLEALEKQAVVISLENLLTYPFVQKGLNEFDMSVHGLWVNIGVGGLEQYDPRTGTFLPL